MKAIHYIHEPDDTTPACKVDRRFNFIMTDKLEDVTCRACIKTAVLYWKDAPIDFLKKLL